MLASHKQLTYWGTHEMDHIWYTIISWPTVDSFDLANHCYPHSPTHTHPHTHTVYAGLYLTFSIKKFQIRVTVGQLYLVKHPFWPDDLVVMATWRCEHRGVPGENRPMPVLTSSHDLRSLRMIRRHCFQGPDARGWELSRQETSSRVLACSLTEPSFSGAHRAIGVDRRLSLNTLPFQKGAHIGCLRC